MKTKGEARVEGLQGWNIRCNHCGSYGAEWLRNMRPDYGAYCACPSCAQAIRDEIARHQAALAKLLAVNYEQDMVSRRFSVRYEDLELADA